MIYGFEFGMLAYTF